MDACPYDKKWGKLIAFVGNTLLDMYAKAGSIEDAKKVFDRLDKRDVVSWNSMLTGCAQHGLGKETVARFELMLSDGIKPNAITFLCVLNACSHGGLLNEGHHYFELMKKYMIVPEVEHYVTMVDLLGRAGLLKQAESFIREMPIEPNAAVWGALLGSCRMYGNMELGVFAAERVFELDPFDPGPHVLLCNIYASASRWKDVARVRKVMKDGGVKKEPACSWVDIENAVHMFVANDDAHPECEEIRRMWEKVSSKIKEVGYVPDTSHVLFNVDEQEREEKLQYHSEKLALAFALLRTTPGSTIRIKKNIRVCGDCHTAIKYWKTKQYWSKSLYLVAKKALKFGERRVFLLTRTSLSDLKVMEGVYRSVEVFFSSISFFFSTKPDLKVPYSVPTKRRHKKA
ncbi:hypothetical protein Scep_024722 [Stephania cephalantha]|uniref:DYW domain-containing protein n=1 Tax=Stephania cephalantha TaxID=152367 RepID=A0AAP0HXD6_9MAGN